MHCKLEICSLIVSTANRLQHCPTNHADAGSNIIFPMSATHIANSNRPTRIQRRPWRLARHHWRSPRENKPGLKKHFWYTPGIISNWQLTSDLWNNMFLRWHTPFANARPGEARIILGHHPNVPANNPPSNLGDHNTTQCDHMKLNKSANGPGRREGFIEVFHFNFFYKICCTSRQKLDWKQYQHQQVWAQCLPCIPASHWHEHSIDAGESSARNTFRFFVHLPDIWSNVCQKKTACLSFKPFPMLKVSQTKTLIVSHPMFPILSKQLRGWWWIYRNAIWSSLIGRFVWYINSQTFSTISTAHSPTPSSMNIKRLLWPEYRHNACKYANPVLS